MAVLSEMNISQLDFADRIDAEYFQPSFLHIAMALDGKGVKLGSLGKLVCSAFYPPATQLYESGDIPFIRGVDVISYPIIDSKQPFERIPQYFIDQNRTVKTVSAGDIIITKVGTPCYAGIINHDLQYAALTRTVLGIINIDRKLVDPFYLVAFLRSDYGFYQLMREREQQIQLQLTLERVARINVPIPPMDIQNRIGELLQLYYSTLNDSNRMFKEAGDILVRELNISDISPMSKTVYFSNFSSMVASNRFDAEYFQPKYQRIVENLQSSYPSNIVSVNDVVEILTNGHTPLHHDLTQGEVTFLTAEHISDYFVNFQSEKRILYTHHENELKRTALNIGDILVTIKGRVGNAAIVEELHGPTNINQDVALLRLRRDIHPYYFVGFLNSPVGKAFVEQICTGQINPFLGLGNLRRIPFPVPSEALMNHIGDAIQLKIREARMLRKHADEVFDEAKSRVDHYIHTLE